MDGDFIMAPSRPDGDDACDLRPEPVRDHRGSRSRRREAAGDPFGAGDGPFKLDRADLRALFQPIASLAGGEVVGFETLARLKVGDDLLAPSAFLPALRGRASVPLLQEMLRLAGDFLERLPPTAAEAYVSVNVEASVLVLDEFLEAVRVFCARHGTGACRRVVFEILESHAIDDVGRAARQLDTVRALGMRIALDDLGSAYSSLSNLRDLPADIIKLDHSFACHLGERPRDLALILSLQSLAANLGKQLIVEGVETPDIHDALRMIGVTLGQGYFIAKPMAPEAVLRWLAGYSAPDLADTPSSLLGAYAAHLRVTEACRVMTARPLPIAWTPTMQDPHACAIGRFFDRSGLHDTAFGRAHKRFHFGMGLCRVDRSAWRSGADAFRTALEGEIMARSGRPLACDAL